MRLPFRQLWRSKIGSLLVAVRHSAKGPIPLHSAETGLGLQTGSLTTAIKSKSGEGILNRVLKRVKFLAVPRDVEQSTSRPVSPGISRIDKGYP